MIVTPMEAEKDTKRHAQIEWLPEASSLSSGNKSSWVEKQENSYFALKNKYHFSEPFTMYGKQAPLSATWCQVLCIQAERDRRDAGLFGGENRGVLAVLDSSQWKLDSHEWIVTGILVAFHFLSDSFPEFFWVTKTRTGTILTLRFHDLQIACRKQGKHYTKKAMGKTSVAHGLGAFHLPLENICSALILGLVQVNNSTWVTLIMRINHTVLYGA